jgi:hypothetical protein
MESRKNASVLTALPTPEFVDGLALPHSAILCLSNLISILLVCGYQWTSRISCMHILLSLPFFKLCGQRYAVPVLQWWPPFLVVTVVASASVSNPVS